MVAVCKFDNEVSRGVINVSSWFAFARTIAVRILTVEAKNRPFLKSIATSIFNDMASEKESDLWISLVKI
ncbi:MAG: hypothetical protein IPL42_03385 [Saprospiraceae bacterium]|nr:hypothetical protein [Saprospiraceae bacterium]